MATETMLQRAGIHGQSLLPAAGAVFAIGVACGLVQVVLIRQLLVVCSGSELTVGLILAVWMLGGALGVLWGGRQARRDPNPSLTAARLVFLCFLCILLSLSATSFVRVSPELFRHLPGLLTAQRGEVLGLVQTLLLTIMATLPVVFALEAAFGSALGIYGALRPTEHAAGHCYAIDALGHLVGGGAAAYILTFWLDAYTALVAGGLLCLLAATGLWSSLRDRERPPRLALFGMLIVAGCAILPGAQALDLATLAVRWRGYTLIENTDTLQSNIAVARHGEEGKVFFINGVPTAYTETMPSTHLLVHFTMLQHPDPQSVLLVGGLGTGAVEEVLKHSPAHVDYFELDPGLLDVYERHRGGLPGGPVVIHRTDLRAWLRANAGSQAARWDAIIIALPSPLSAVVNRHYTRECYEQLLAESPRAVVGLQLPGTQTYYSADLLRLDVGLLEAAAVREGGTTALMPGYSLFVVLGPEGAALVTDPHTVLDRLAQRRVSAAYWESVIFDLLEPMNVRFVTDQLSGYPAPPRNTDLRPISYFHNQVYAMKQVDPGGAGLLDGCARLRLPVLLAVAAAVGLAVAVLVLISGGARFIAVPAVVAGTGFIGMVLQLGIIYAFQVYVGHIYSLIGLLSGGFMVGLAAGGLIGTRLLPGRCPGLSPVTALGASVTLLALSSLAFTGIVGLLVGALGGVGPWAPVTGFMLLSVFVGGLVGIQFPLATEAVAAEANRGPVAAAMYGADLAGAGCGALVAGAILVPLFGLSGCGLLCGVIACALLCICVARTRTR